MKSGYDQEINDWSSRDELMLQVIDPRFMRFTFHEYPSLRSKHPLDGGWVQSKPYHGEPFNEADWFLKPGGWDHEHCFLCYATIREDMTYWANAGEVKILCDYCHEHYQTELTELAANYIPQQ
jgi:hypothetical protein